MSLCDGYIVNLPMRFAARLLLETGDYILLEINIVKNYKELPENK